MKHLYIFGMLFFLSAGLLHGQGELLFHEGFEGGVRPDGWTEELVTGPLENWRYRNGGHNPLDPNNLVPPGSQDLGRNPDMAREGTYNAYFQKESTNNEATRLITRELNLEFAIKPELRFWHAQVPWIWGGESNHDILRVYYRTHKDDTWNLLAEYTDPYEDWTQHAIPLPDPTPTYYIAFEAQTRWGHGVVLDEIEIVETGEVDRFVQSLTVTQASTDNIVAGTGNNEVLRIHVKVYGNTGNLELNSVKVTSLNTSDTDIVPGGVKLFRTISSGFSTTNQVGLATSFSGGEALFSGLNYNLPTGDTYLWIACDLEGSAVPDNIIDVMLDAGSLGISGSVYPDSPVSPPGSRMVLEAIFFDNFTENRGWTLTGEFQIAVPQGGGGTIGNPNPSSPYSGTSVLGTDLTGLGNYEYRYEPNLNDTSEHYQAITPPIDLFYFKNTAIRFRQWLNIEMWDGAYIEVSDDGGVSWKEVWRNYNFVLDNSWVPKTYDISALADRREEVQIRFGLGDTDEFNNYTGWNIDNFIVTGDYITRDVGVTGWLGPEEDCGMSEAETVTVRIGNFAAIPVEDPVAVAYSLDDGQTWVEEYAYASIPVGGTYDFSFETKADFSQPGQYRVMARTNYDGDQEASNDALTTEFLSIPRHILPHHEGFEGSSIIFWRQGGVNSSWELGTPSGAVIDAAAEGNNSWVTGLIQPYNEEESSWVEGPCFDLSGHNNPVFEMTTIRDIAPGDNAAVYYSNDGKETWHILGSPGDGEEYSWNWYNTPGGWSGQNDEWLTSRLLMPEGPKGSPDVCFRVAFNSGSGEKVHDGFGFDGLKIYNAPYDAGVASVLHPVSGCAYLDPAEVIVEIENYGLETIPAGTEITAGLDVDNKAMLLETFLLEEDLPVGSRLVYTFDGNAELAGEGDFVLNAYTIMEGDFDFFNQGTSNDSVTVTITLSPIPQVNLGKDIYTVLTDTVFFNVETGIAGHSYEWQDGSASPFFDVEEEGVYHVTITDPVGCWASDTVRVVRLIADIGVTALLSPLTSCGLGDEERLSFEIRNFGTDTLITGRQFQIHFSVEGGEVVTETVTTEVTLLPDSTMQYTTEERFNMSATGLYTMQSWTVMEHDNNPGNDFFETVTEVYGYPTFDLGDDVTVFNIEYEVDAGIHFTSLVWHDGSTGQKFVVTEPGLNTVSVTVTDANGCKAWDDVNITLEILDIELDAILSPETSCGAPHDIVVSARIRNTGTVAIEAGSSVEMGFSVNEGNEILEELLFTSPFEPGDVAEYLFAATVSLEKDNWYNFKVFSILPDDMVKSNDTLDVSVGIFDPPVVDLGPDIATFLLEYTVDAGPGYASWLWHDGSTGQTFTASVPGINNISVTITDENGCQATDQMQVVILISDLGVSEIDLAGNTCPETSEPLRVAVTNYGNTNISTSSLIYVSYRVNDGAVVTERLTLSTSLGAGNVVYHDFAEISGFPEPGEQTVTAWTTYASDPFDHNDTLSTLITVHPSPFPDIGNGGSIYTLEPVLLDAGPGFMSYEWQDGSSEQTLLVGGPADRWFTVFVTDINGCAGSDSVFVNIPEADLAMEAVEGPESACEPEGPAEIRAEIRNMGIHPVPAGEEISLHYRINQGATVNESLDLPYDLAPGALISYTFSTPVELNDPGTYDMTVWLEYGRDLNFQNDSALHTTMIYGYPSVSLGNGADTLYGGLPVTLDAGGGYSSYSWNDGSGGQTFQVTGSGTYWVTVADQYGCEGSDTVVVESTLSVADPFAGNVSVRVYPNPASERLFVVIESDVPGGRIGVDLVNLRGVTLYKNELHNTDRFSEVIETGSLPKGMYILKITLGDKHSTQTILVN